MCFFSLESYNIDHSSKLFKFCSYHFVQKLKKLNKQMQAAQDLINRGE